MRGVYVYVPTQCVTNVPLGARLPIDDDPVSARSLVMQFPPDRSRCGSLYRTYPSIQLAPLLIVSGRPALHSHVRRQRWALVYTESGTNGGVTRGGRTASAPHDRIDTLGVQEPVAE